MPTDPFLASTDDDQRPAGRAMKAADAALAVPCRGIGRASRREARR
jgi:hypothetical protein